MVSNYVKIALRNALKRNKCALQLFAHRRSPATTLIATLLAFPVAFLLMQKWLQNFAYHIDVSWLSFVCVVLSFMVAIGLVVSLQTIKAAWMNPVKSLRSE